MNGSQRGSRPRHLRSVSPHSHRLLIPLSVAFGFLLALQGKTLLDMVLSSNPSTGGLIPSALIRPSLQQQYAASHSNNDATTSINTVTGLRVAGGDPTHATALSQGTTSTTTCRWYLAESAIPHGGLGVFTAVGLHKDDMVGFPDLCIYVSDAPDHWTHLRSHTFGGGTFFGQYEGRNSRAACEGFTTTYNTVPDRMVNTELVSPVLQTNAGLDRATSPGAGAISHQYGIHGRAVDVIRAGSELTINYGDWDFEQTTGLIKPHRPVSWLEQHGWCVDKLQIGRSTIPHAGRGAFARMDVTRGEVLAPAPLQAFADRKVFQATSPEQLYVNYCLQPKDSTMLLFPYGPAVNLVNHHNTPNVQWQWSSNHLHHSSWLDLDWDGFWNVASPGGLILELVALRDIAQGEEILVDYGPNWIKAWEAHVAQWQPTLHADAYVYPAELDETEILRTMDEQAEEPYPSNLATMCITADWDREDSKRMVWREPTDWTWWEGMAYCHVLEKEVNDVTGDYDYTVSLIFSYDPDHLVYNPKFPMKQRNIDTHVPRHAIRFVEIPYGDDEHLKNVFRHPMELPELLTAPAWKNRG